MPAMFLWIYTIKPWVAFISRGQPFFFMMTTKAQLEFRGTHSAGIGWVLPFVPTMASSCRSWFLAERAMPAMKKLAEFRW